MKFSITSGIKKVEKEGFLAAKRIVQIFVHFWTPELNKACIFVAGNQRSGTNMVMDIIERSFQTEVFHESDNRAFKNYEMRDKDTIKKLVAESHAQFVVVKALCESQYLKQLLDDFSNIGGPAKAIWVVRNYNDVVNSMLARFSGMAKQAISIANNRSSAGWRGSGMSDETHSIISSLINPDIDDATASALQWYYRNILFFEQDFQINPNSVLIRYEAIVTNPKSEVRTLLSSLGLKFSNSICKDIFTNSIKKHDPPTIDKKVRKLCDDLTNRFNDLFNGDDFTKGQYSFRNINQ